ncbi:putative bifunctional diguanylate cyclase/phosphodiesterase [Oceanospirillum sediminis]|uniref:cyclic-guanylate-specific phosphodiesterase n=1 Tax=Oceanospirillum sediminis TaxID=2760088 RepID=A0A839IPE8_9GAMM|nr:EAL domain-containing protein [Oceanospirillum sediminis]MBB1486126.1 EAL domain-containing protein [Oceanospirillum sediminis]
MKKDRQVEAQADIMDDVELLRLRQQLEERISKRTEELQQVRRKLQQEIGQHKATANRLELVNRIVEKAHFAITITDADQNILYTNPAYTCLTGRKASDVKGMRASINQSGRHDLDFYRQMWQTLSEYDYWEGEVWDRRVDGSHFMKYLSIETVRDEEGKITNFFSIFTDLTDQKRTEQELERLTHYDPLTDLPNRILFRNRLGHEFNIANRHNSRTGLILLNIDRFTLINRAFGFDSGDDLLIEAAERLRGCIRCTDLLARQEQRLERDADMISRLGGDDFSFILSELRSPEDAGVVARRLSEVFEKPFLVKGEEVYLSASMGIGVYPDNAHEEDDLIQMAQGALDQVKKEGKGGYRFCSDDQNRSSAERVRLETRLRKAVQNEEFQLFYQPKTDLASGQIKGMEALLRWPQPDGSMVPPDEFIPLTEDTGLINPLGYWIVRQAFLDTNRINKLTEFPLQVAINLSVRQFRNPELVIMVSDLIRETGINPEWVEFEITESMLIEKVDEACEVMKGLRKLGVELAIDDFGTGYSSLSYLRHFPVNTLKIDQTFIRDLSSDESSESIVRAIIGLGHGLGLKIVAEGIETQVQSDFLKSTGCQLGQGYYMSRPLPLKDFIKLL